MMKAVIGMRWQCVDMMESTVLAGANRQPIGVQRCARYGQKKNEIGNRRRGRTALGGTHFCHFYETDQDLLDIVVPYFRAGLDAHEYCLWVVAKPLNKKIARWGAGQAIPDFDQHLAAGDIEIVAHKRWYLEDGVFDAKRLINGWKQKLAEALAKGYAGMRANGKAEWSTWDDFHKYESEINKMIINQPLIILCTYPLAVTKANEVFDVARSHHLPLPGEAATGRSSKRRS